MTPISSLAKDELSRWIADKMEPKPKRDIETVRGQKSKYGWWRIEVEHWSWEPCPYDDPEIAMRLLKWLIENGLKPYFIHLNVGGKSTRLLCASVNGEGSCMDGDLDRAIAESFALANGWKP